MHIYVLHPVIFKKTSGFVLKFEENITCLSETILLIWTNRTFLKNGVFFYKYHPLLVNNFILKVCKEVFLIKKVCAGPVGIFFVFVRGR